MQNFGLLPTHLPPVLNFVTNPRNFKHKRRLYELKMTSFLPSSRPTDLGEGCQVVNLRAVEEKETKEGQLLPSK